MKTRIISAIVLLPILLLTLYLGGTVLKLNLLFLSLVGIYEFYRAVNGKHLKINYFGYIFTICYYAFLDTEDVMLSILMLMVFTLVLFCYAVLTYPKTNITIVSTTLLGVMYVPILFSYVYYVRALDDGLIYVWLILISAFATDTFAYFSGLTFGKHKLVPQLSPHKTIEGSIGGIIGAVVTSAIYGLIVAHYVPTFTHEMIITVIIIVFFGSIFSQFGDLTASSIKRYTNIKDFGKLIPGHGGVLDRFDSVLFTAPVVYLAIYTLSKLGLIL